MSREWRQNGEKEEVGLMFYGLGLLDRWIRGPDFTAELSFRFTLGREMRWHAVCIKTARAAGWSSADRLSR